MTIKSTVLTKSSFNKQLLSGRKIVGIIQSGNSNESLPMYGAYMNVYTPDESGSFLSDLGFDPNTIGSNVTLGVEHQNADLNDFNFKVKVERDNLQPGTVLDLDTVKVMLKDSTVDATKSIEVSIVNLTDIAEPKTMFFAVTYSCEQNSDHYHVVWAKLVIDVNATDPVNWVQIRWLLQDE
jgi:hypothetical protein